MKPISVHQLADGMYLVKTDGTEGEDFPSIVSSMREQLQAAGFAVNVSVEPIGQQVVAQRPSDEIAEKLLRMALKQLPEFRFPCTARLEGPEALMFFRTGDLSGAQTDETTQAWGGRVSEADLRAYLTRKGWLVTGSDGAVQSFQRTIGGKRLGKLVALKVLEAEKALSAQPTE